MDPPSVKMSIIERNLFLSAYFLLLQVSRQIVHCHILKFFGYMRVDIQRRAYVRVSEHILYHLYIHAGLAHAGREGMPECVAAEPRQEHRHIIAFMIIQHLLVAVANDPSERLVDHSQIQYFSEPVAEYEVLISVYDARAVKSLALLIALLLEKRLSD